MLLIKSPVDQNKIETHLIELDLHERIFNEILLSLEFFLYFADHDLRSTALN